MKSLSITSEQDCGVTLLSNIFIDYYMKDANDAQIKVYLYLLRMIASGQDTDISMIADVFNHTEKDIIRSPIYWEQLHLLTLSYDVAHNINGIQLTAPSRPCRDKQDEEVTIPESRQVQQVAAAVAKTIDYEMLRNSYTLDDLKSFKSDPEVTCLIMVAEQYIGRPLSSSELRTLLFFHRGLSFTTELTDYLLQFCIEGGQKSFHYIEKTAINWFEQGITTVEQAKGIHHKADDNAYRILSFLGRKGEPAPQELEIIDRWLKTYKLPIAIIEEACNRTVLATANNRFSYADSILKEWFLKGVRTKEDIAALDQKYRDSKQNMPPKRVAARSAYDNSAFCRIEKRDYDLDAVVKALTVN